MAPPHWYRFGRGSSVMGALDVSCSDHVRAEMQPGELLRWSGRPGPTALVRSLQKFRWFGLLYRGRRAYAVTDRRLLILHGVPPRRIESFWPADINVLAVTESAGGHGDIVFQQRVVRGEEDSETIRCGFFGIAAVRDVARLVDDLRGSAGDTAAPKVAGLRPSDLPDRIAALLIPGEAALWCGRQGRIDDLGGRILGLAMPALVAAFVFGDRMDRWPPLSSWSIIPVVIAAAIGWHLLSELARLLGARRNLYVLTETRLIILPPWPPFDEPHSFGLANIGGIERTSRPDGTGDIRFHQLVKRGKGDEAEYATGGLFGIADARAVEALLARRGSIRPLAHKRVP